MAALTDATPWLRRKLAERITMRSMPQLIMKRDDSIEEGDRVLKILRQLEDEREASGRDEAAVKDAPDGETAG
jgi:ribosome-binding factor A